jgi:hypothetical protein
MEGPDRVASVSNGREREKKNGTEARREGNEKKH